MTPRLPVSAGLSICSGAVMRRVSVRRLFGLIRLPAPPDEQRLWSAMG
jgi:hypothetical protein